MSVKHEAPATSSGGGYATVEEEGAAVTQRTTINFVGDAITVTDTGGKTTVTTAAPTLGQALALSRGMAMP